jgi:methionyl-tRNA synthetase
MSKFYITSAIPYVNAKPHIGWALEITQADTVSRYKKLLGDEVLYLCGSDENSLKNVQAAEAAGETVQVFVDSYANRFREMAEKLHVTFDAFQKGSDAKHHSSSQRLWELCMQAGDIYKKTYSGLYCVGCEEFKTSDQLNEQGECPEHPGKKLEVVEEENYFFRLSKYQEKLMDLYTSGAYDIIPDFRKNEIVSFLRSGLEDFSISRSNERAKNWGVPVPGDDTQRMYVWFDALNIYQSGIGFGSAEQNDIAKYKKWWPADLHMIGKGIIRFHAVYWPAILMSAGLALPKKLFVHEYITVDGQKMSKSLGNVIDPVDLINRYGADALRYYFLARITPFQDGDFSEEKLKEVYNADLANGIGNLIARIAKLAERVQFTSLPTTPLLSTEFQQLMDQYNFYDAIGYVWGEIRKLDKLINEKEPWKLEEEELKGFLTIAVIKIIEIAYHLRPFLPETAAKIEKQFTNGPIKSGEPLFPRI